MLPISQSHSSLYSKSSPHYWKHTIPCKHYASHSTVLFREQWQGGNIYIFSKGEIFHPKYFQFMAGWVHGFVTHENREAGTPHWVLLKLHLVCVSVCTHMPQCIRGSQRELPGVSSLLPCMSQTWWQVPLTTELSCWCPHWILRKIKLMVLNYWEFYLAHSKHLMFVLSLAWYLKLFLTIIHFHSSNKQGF